MAHRKSRALQLAAFLLVGASSVALAQQSPGLAQGPPFGRQQVPAPEITPDSSAVTLKVTTQLTIENVTVTDAAGKPILGLKQSDFTAKEDGKPQKIKDFEEYGAAKLSQQSAHPPALPPRVYTNAQSPGLQTGAVNILLFDNVTTGIGVEFRFSPQYLVYAKQQAIKYLKTMPQGTQVAILKTANQLRVVQGFTSDRGVLLAAIDSVKPERVVGATMPDQQPSFPGDAPIAPEEVCRVGNTQSDLTLGALAAVARFVSGIKGRKNLMWFTPGIPWLTNFTRFSMVPCLSDDSAQLHNVYGLLNAAQVAVYPISPRAGEPCAPRGTGEFTDPSFYTCTLNTLRLNHESLLDIANNTGGKAYYDWNDLDAAIGEAIDNGAHSYSLSYEPPSSKYGKYHKVEIAVDRPGLHLQYRESYTTVDLSKPLVDKKDAKNAPAPDSDFHAAVDQGVIPSTGLLFYLRLTPSPAQAKPGDPAVAGTLNPKLKGKPLLRYALVYEMPPGEVTLVDGPDGTRKGSLEFDAVAYGEDGEKLNVVREVETFPLKANEVEHFLKNPVVMPIQIDLPPGKVDLHVGILDISSQKMGTLEITGTVTQSATQR